MQIRIPPLRRLLGALVVLATLSACAPADAADELAGEVRAGQQVHEGHGASPEAFEPSGTSLYNLSSAWTDQLGRSLTLADLSGRLQVVAMVYTHCAYACPRIVGDLKRIEAEAAQLDIEDRVGFVLVSIDPERDTPERLRHFAESTRLDASRWTLLHGSDDQVLELSVLLGVKYRSTGQGEFTHSNLLTVLDEKGEIVARVEGLGSELEPALAVLRSRAR